MSRLNKSQNLFGTVVSAHGEQRIFETLVGGHYVRAELIFTAIESVVRRTKIAALAEHNNSGGRVEHIGESLNIGILCSNDRGNILTLGAVERSEEHTSELQSLAYL